MRNRINTRLLWLGLALASVGGTASAQDYTFGWNPRSGDVWVDTWLGDVNRYGNRYRDPFADEMVRYYGAPRDLVTDLLVRQRWAPGDVYYACAIAQIIGRPCRYVVDEWNRDHGQGWGVVAKRLGIKPGSAEFHRLKKGFVPSYDRWGRGIDLDAQLRRDYPNHGKAKAKGQGNAAHGNSGQHGKPDKDHGPGNADGNGKGKSKGNGGNGKGKGNGKH